MITLGLIGRPDVPGVHDATACLVVDGKVVGALEQERISRRRHAHDEGPEGAVRALLDAAGLHPADIEAIGYAWADAPKGTAARDTDIPCGVYATDRLTQDILPGLAGQLRNREMIFFDHHLAHAASAYFLNRHEKADILVADGYGGDGSTSLFHVDAGRFRLLERYDRLWSLGLFYAAAATYAQLGWWGAGKLMGLSSYGRTSDRRFLTFDPADASFALGPGLRGDLTGGLDWGRIATQWLEAFERNVFPHTPSSANIFDYAPFAADVQATVEDVGLGMTARLRRLSGEDALLLAGGVVLNAHMNRRIARESGYRYVSSLVAPNDGGAALGAAFLAESLLGKTPSPLVPSESFPAFLGPRVSTGAVEAALANAGLPAVAMEEDQLCREIASALGRDQTVAWFNGANEFGPRALGARSLLVSPTGRDSLDRLNRIKGREPWRPAALSLTGEGFQALGMEPPVSGLSDHMLCMHKLPEEHQQRAIAGVHVDHTTRGQYVSDSAGPFGALLEAVGEESGLPAVINTSLNIKGEPMVLHPAQALDLMAASPDVDLLAMPPYVVRRS